MSNLLGEFAEEDGRSMSFIMRHSFDLGEVRQTWYYPQNEMPGITIDMPGLAVISSECCADRFFIELFRQAVPIGWILTIGLLSIAAGFG